ncbi:hypothetical protein [Larkinella rosea]|uniref:Uncharacterized protein n=1 Tax=Larkinella rosea TaxID=2025312 RepID=A0A3P1BIN4_9BACT|nr:hypothetical protein [Larkinella rosea]RRB00756.1 hypothetical protein EHT25_21405 [Larkinella rosea]
MRQQYSQNIEKLIWNESFRKWVLHPTPESDAFWYIWQVSNPDRIDDLKLARTVVAAVQVRDPQLPEFELQELIAQTVSRVQPENPATDARSFRWQPLGWVALVLLLTVLGWFLLNN